MKPLLVMMMFLCSCAVRQSFDTTAMAVTQEQVMADTSLCPQLEKFQALRDAQAAIVKTNLTVRQDVIRSKCIGKAKLYTQAFEDVKKLSASEYGYWPEYWSYWNYTRAAFDWYGLGAMERPIFDAVSSRFQALTAPDGNIPLPETVSDQIAPIPSFMEARFPVGVKAVDTMTVYFRYPYLVLRWWKVKDTITDTVGEYLLVSLDTGTNDLKSPLRLNLHHHPDFGMAAHFKQGKWISRTKPYGGWNPAELLSEAESIGVPRGPWSSPVWRVTLFQNTFTATDTSITLWYSSLGVRATRLIRFNRDSVVSIKDW